MARSSLLNTDTEDLKELLANGKRYIVPPYQRDYSWKQEHWEDLWEDILALEKSQGDHYMGSIVLQSSDRKFFRIIDGQQRIATLSILILACIDFLRELGDGHRATLLETAYVGGRNPVSLLVECKLTLNAHDDDFYQLNLTQQRAPAGGSRNLSDSERLLWECRQFFGKHVREHFSGTKRCEDVARFVDEIVTARLVFISVRVQDELSAYTVFETLNARGLELSEPDLLKNYLLSLADRSSKSQMEPLLKQWHRIAARVGTGRLPLFLRHHLNSHREYVRQKELFKRLKVEVHDLTGVFALLESLEVDAAWYHALGNPNDDFWLDYPGAREPVRVLCLFGVTQYLPLALAAKDALPPSQIVDVLRCCAVISVRFNGISHRSTHILEATYNELAIALRQGEIKNLPDLRRRLEDIYIPDEEFVADFANLRIEATGRSGKRLRYLLCELEKRQGIRDLSDETSPNLTIEHILPENPGVEWDAAFPRPDQDRYADRLGNYALLEKSLNNREAGNAAFAVKRAVYERSQYSTTKAIAGHEDWTPAIVAARQAQMAKQAKTIWRLDIPPSP